MKYTKSPDKIGKSYWVKIKKVGSKYYKVVPYDKAQRMLNKDTKIINIKGTEVKIAVGNSVRPNVEYKVVY